MTYRFAFAWGYMGHTGTRVSGTGEPFEVAVRHTVSDYERRHMSGGEDAFVQAVAEIGMLRREHNIDREMPAELVAAFNAFRAAEHARSIVQIEADPRKYGVLDADDPIRVPPITAWGARYVRDVGWHVNGAPVPGLYPCGGCGAWTLPSALAPVLDRRRNHCLTDIVGRM